MAKKWIWLALVVALAACTYVPPESIGPVVDACRKQGLEVSIHHGQIRCFKREGS